MTAFDHGPWKNGIRCSPTAPLARRALISGDVIAPHIADPSGLIPIDPSFDVLDPACCAPAFRHFAQGDGRLTDRHPGIRVLPLQAFVWGKRAIAPQPRTRSDHVLIWVTHGDTLLAFPRNHLRLHAGDLRHIPAGTAFSAIPSAGSQGHVTLISARLASQAVPSLPQHGLAAHVGGHAAQLHATLQEFAAEMPDPDPGTLSCLMNLLAMRLRQLAPARPPEADPIGPSDRPLIDRFQAMVRHRLGEVRSMAEIAADLHTTTVLLDQACLAAHGKRAIEVVHDLQLECAVTLLRETTRSTQRIAAELGYSSHAHFVRACVAATGRTPDAFRRQSR